MTAIAIRELTKDYGATRAVDGLDLDVGAGEIVGFLGPNGAGKSTTIRILLDLIRPTTGRAQVMGHDCQTDGVRARALCGYLPGDLRLHESWRAHEVVRHFADMRGSGADRRAVAELSERLALDLGRRVGALSKGNRQKLGLLLALAPRPPVLILDEPTAGLDPIRQRAVWQLLRERADDGAAVLFSSHVMSEVESVCDRVAVLRRGRLLATAPVGELLAGAGAGLRVTFQGSPPSFDGLPGVAVSGRVPGGVDLEIHGDPNPLIARLARGTVESIEMRPARLEDVVLGLYEREEVA